MLLWTQPALAAPAFASIPLRAYAPLHPRVPGQFVAARYCSDGTSTEGCAAGSLRVAQRLMCLASSPYEARRDSAMLDASLVELLVSRSGEPGSWVLGGAVVQWAACARIAAVDAAMHVYC